ncbi:glucosaminidase domain-containing protein [uncultured Lutibacter sp.]|uniref:glucosaminidase domain-containing protein n=1 Tax=uncultured Lutibacter sp. TaxID=437739 RepID=UPI0034465475
MAKASKVKQKEVIIEQKTSNPISKRSQIQPTIKDATLAYIEKYKQTAMDEMKIYKIPASITLAQGILESSSGKSELTRKSNNHFGIKCHRGWEGDKTYHDDDAKGECFRVYKDPSKSFRDHSLFLKHRSRYSKLFKYNQGDYVAWAKGLSEAGYATDRRYPAKLIALIEKYDLHKYDTQVLGTAFKIDEEVKERIVFKESNKEIENLAEGFHRVRAKETLFSISKKYGLTVKELKKLNKLRSNNLYVGQKLQVVDNKTIVNKKTTTHNVKEGDTLYSISKKYNLTIQELKILNGLNSNNISVGQTLLITK